MESLVSFEIISSLYVVEEVMALCFILLAKYLDWSRGQEGS